MIHQLGSQGKQCIGSVYLVHDIYENSLNRNAAGYEHHNLFRPDHRSLPNPGSKMAINLINKSGHKNAGDENITTSPNTQTMNPT